MARLEFDKETERLYETGVFDGVLFSKNNSGAYTIGVPWNGLTNVTESPSGAEATPLYADSKKYLDLISAEQFGATIEAYTYPDEFGVCDGSAEIAPGVQLGQQSRRSFGLVYKSYIGNDVEHTDYGYKLHIMYGARVAPSEKAYATVNDSPEAITFSWPVTTTPVALPGFKPSAILTINSKKVNAAKLKLLEDIIYGTAASDSRMPTLEEVQSIFVDAAPGALTISTIVPADDATAIAVNSSIVITFNNKILSESIVVMTSTGTIVTGSKSWDATGKILTFVPTENLAATTSYLVCVAHVVDMYNQVLEATTKNFTTAA